MSLLNRNSIIDSITPDVYISKIILENTNNSLSEQKDSNPHIDISLSTKKISDPLTGKLKNTRSTSMRSPHEVINKTETNNKLIVTIELVLKQKSNNNILTTFLQNHNFSKYLRLKIIQSKAEILTKGISENKAIFSFLNKGAIPITKKVLNNAINGMVSKLKIASKDNVYNIVDSMIEHRIFNVQNDIIGDATKLSQQYVEIDENGDSIINYVFRTKFEIVSNSPEHLTYFAFSYIDLQEMAKDFNMKLDTQLFIKPYGKVVSDAVFQNFELVGHSYVYLDQNNKIWVGPISEISVGKYFGIAKNGLQTLLFRKMVENSKIQDFRNFENIERLQLNFSIIDNEFVNNKLINFRKDKLDINNNENSTFSEFYLTRDHDKNSRFLFSIDIRELLESHAVYGKLFSLKSEFSKTAIEDSSIVSMKIFRRRVRGSPEIGSISDITHLFDSNQIDELIMSSGEHSYKNFINKNNKIGALREIEKIYVQTIDGFGNLSNVRHFTGIDKTISSITDGYYIYGVELEISDPSYNFVKKAIDRLRHVKSKLQSYYLECVKLDSTKTIIATDNPHIDFSGEIKIDNTTIIPGNFNPILNRFTEKFINEQIRKYSVNFNEAPWVLAVKTYIELLQLFSIDLNSNLANKYEKALLNFTHPVTGNPTGILKILNLFETFEVDLIKSVGSSVLSTIPSFNSGQPVGSIGRERTLLVPLNAINSKKSLSFKTFKVIKFFDSVFNASVPKSIGYDFLDVEDSVKNGLKTITGEEYQQRVDRETNHYFSLPETETIGADTADISIRYKGQEYTSGDSINRTSFSYLTPSKINFGDRFKINRLGRSPSPIANKTLLASLDVVVKNYNTSTSPLKSSTETAIKSTSNSNSIESKLINRDVFSLMSKMNIEPVVKFNKLKIPLVNVLSPRIHKRPEQIIDPIIEEHTVCDVDDDTAEEIKKSNSTPVLLELAKRLDTGALNSKQSMLTTSVSKTSNGEKLTIKMFDLASEKNSINKLIENYGLHKAEAFFQGESHNTSIKDSLIKLPNQIKSLFLSRTSPGVVRNNYFNINVDPLKDVELKSEFRLSYQMINSVQVFSGYRKSITGEFLLKEPIWLPLTLFIYNQATGGDLICRLKPYENRIIGVVRDKGLELPVYDEYFILSPRKDAVGMETPEIIKPSEPALVPLVPPTIDRPPEIEVRSIAPKIPATTITGISTSELPNQFNTDLSFQNTEQLYFRAEFISNNLVNNYNNDDSLSSINISNFDGIRNKGI